MSSVATGLSDHAPSPIERRLGAPGVIAFLWLATALVHAFDQVRFPGGDEVTPYVSSILYLSAGPVLAGLLAAAMARTRRSALPLAGGLLLVELTTSIVWLASEFALTDADELTAIAAAMLVTTIGASAFVIVGMLRPSGVSAWRRTAVAAVALTAMVAWQSLSMFDDTLLTIASRNASAQAPDTEFTEVDEERLWSAQPALVQRTLASLDSSPTRGAKSFVVTVAAGGIQDLFGREARMARTVLERAFGAEGRSILLANDGASLHRVPLANNANLDAVLGPIGRIMNPNTDLLVIYLASHGSRDAELSTDLPDYESLQPIGAKRLAAALDRAQIRRRIVIVSACYAGAWIAPLASDSTIVVTASRADRNSFGCSDDRELTYFGEALLKGPLSSGASLSEGFAAARASVTQWEGDDRHSEPQVSVGRNMRDLWTGKPTIAAAASR